MVNLVCSRPGTALHFPSDMNANGSKTPTSLLLFLFTQIMSTGQIFLLFFAQCYVMTSYEWLSYVVNLLVSTSGTALHLSRETLGKESYKRE